MLHVIKMERDQQAFIQPIKKQRIKWFCLLIIVLSVSAVNASAQAPDTARFVVHYKFTHLRDTTSPNSPDAGSMVLIVGKTASAYRYYGQQTLEDIARQTKQPPSVTPGRPGGKVYYQFFRDKKLERKEPLLFSNFIVTEDLPVINWRISTDAASFGGLHCQKATCHFRGRDYTAWFCPDLPVPAGPWKLNGLPGVIVEAFDAKKQVSFMFDGIEKIALPLIASEGHPDGPQPPMNGGPLMREDNHLIIKLPNNATPTTEKDLQKLFDLGRKDPKALVVALVGNQDPGTPGPKIDMKMAPLPVENNPIELPEKH